MEFFNYLERESIVALHACSMDVEGGAYLIVSLTYFILGEVKRDSETEVNMKSK